MRELARRVEFYVFSVPKINRPTRTRFCCHASQIKEQSHQHHYNSRLTIIPINYKTIMTQGNNYTPNTHDVLLGRGGATNNHAGNKRFRSVVASHQDEYLTAKKKDKAVIARRIVGIIQSNGGNFLRKNTTTDAWEIVEIKKAVEKTSQALREGLNVRRNPTTAKSPRRNSDSENEEPPTKRQNVGKAVSWDESVPSLKEYDAGEATIIPELEDEVFFHFPPSVTQEQCEYIASV